MSDPKSHSKDDKAKTERRMLPSWMNSNESESKLQRKKQADGATQDKGHGCKEPKETRKLSTHSHSGEAAENYLHFSKLLEGVIFALSGFVNPERSTLRSQALEMGAEYRRDWMSDCTLLVCAFPNTPKFRQVEVDCGTIVSKEWIAECYNQRKLVEIDRYLMHAGKPWRKNHNVAECNQALDRGNKISGKVTEQLDKRELQIADGSSTSESGAREGITRHLSPSEVREWATVDLSATISWLEKQDKRPEPDEIKKIAAEGIITCLDDAIEALRHNQDIQSVTERWMFIPRVVKELAELACGTGKGLLAKEELLKMALNCKHVYEAEFCILDDFPMRSKKPKRAGDDHSGWEEKVTVDDEGFDSDSTIEMTEEEIDLAYKRFSCA